MFLHFLAEHRLKGTQYLVLILLPKHVGKLCDFLTFLGATDELFSHYGKSSSSRNIFNISGYHLVDRLVKVNDKRLLILINQTHATKLVGAD